MLGNNIAASLTNDLARFSGLRVSSQVALAALDPHSDFGALGRQLHADGIVQGFITKVPDGLLIQIALVDSKSGEHRWGQSYERKESDMASLEKDLSVEIAYQLRRDGDHFARPPRKTIPSAEDAFRRGETAIALNTQQSAESAASDFQQAIDADPNFALAYERLAKCYLIMGNSYNRPEHERSESKSGRRRPEGSRTGRTLAAAHVDLADG